MIIKHKELVEKGKKILLDKGFKKHQINTEYSIKLKNGQTKIVDIAGIKDDLKVAIECGGLNKPIEMLEEFFDEVILLPYVSRKGRKFHCSNCDSQWFARVDNPKCCPNCKRYFVLPKKLDKKEVEKDAF